MKALIAISLLVNVAWADDVVVLNTQPDYSFLSNAGKKNFDAAAAAIASAATIVASKKTVVRSVMLVNCNKAVRITRVFGDGHTDVTDLQNAPVTNSELAEFAAIYPSMQVITGCSD